MNKPNILSRIKSEVKGTTSHSLGVATAIKSTKYKGEELGEQFTPFEILRMLGDLLVTMENKNTTGAVKEVIANVTKDIIKSDKFSEVTAGASKRTIGTALINIGLNLYALEDAFNKVIEEMIDEEVFEEDDMEFVMDNTDGIELNATVLSKLSKLYDIESPLDSILKILDFSSNEPTLKEFISLYRAGIVSESIFYDLLEEDVITISDLMENTTDDEFSKIMIGVRDVVLKEASKNKSAKKQEVKEEHNCNSCKKSGNCPAELFRSIIRGENTPLDEEKEIREKILDGTATDEEISKGLGTFSLSPVFVKENISSERFERIMMMSINEIVKGLPTIEIKHNVNDTTKEEMNLSSFIKDLILN